MANREYPHDIEAERSLLGSMLISKDKCIDILNKTVEDDFYDDSHQAIFKAMAAINEERHSSRCYHGNILSYGS